VGYQFFSGGVVPIFYTLSTELFPTRVRSLAMGLVVAAARLGSITGPFMLGLLLTLGTQIHQIIYYFTLPLVIAALILVVAVKVDSRQKTLEEVSEESHGSRRSDEASSDQMRTAPSESNSCRAG